MSVPQKVTVTCIFKAPDTIRFFTCTFPTIKIYGTLNDQGLGIFSLPKKLNNRDH